MPFDFHQTSGPLKIVGTNHTIFPKEIAAVLESQSWDTRLAIEHILSLLQTSHEKYSPTSFIDTPETALQTLELLFQGHEDIFDRRKLAKVKKLVLSIMLLLSEHYENAQKYNPSIPRDPGAQNKLYEDQQRLTDAFHFIVWNIIDNTYDVTAQCWDIKLSNITQNEATLERIGTSSDFPNVKRILWTFEHIYSWPKNQHKAA
jgi:hypothetical protein